MPRAVSKIFNISCSYSASKTHSTTVSTLVMVFRVIIIHLKTQFFKIENNFILENNFLKTRFLFKLTVFIKITFKAEYFMKNLCKSYSISSIERFLSYSIDLFFAKSGVSFKTEHVVESIWIVSIQQSKF